MKYLFTILFSFFTIIATQAQNCLQMDIVLVADASGSVGYNTQ